MVIYARSEANRKVQNRQAKYLEPKAKAKGSRLNRKAGRGERGSHLRGEPFTGRTEEQRAEYQNWKERMETGVTEGESREAKAEGQHRRNHCRGRSGSREKQGQKAE